MVGKEAHLLNPALIKLELSGGKLNVKGNRGSKQGMGEAYHRGRVFASHCSGQAFRLSNIVHVKCEGLCM